ncbi:MAG TPA: DUF433 domain-containing protein [Ktedonobacterales bacterium]|jgi:uncharacterized protein (DUF433 family)
MSLEPEKEAEAFTPVPGTQETDIKGIVRTPGVYGGLLRIAGHRIAVHDIAECIHQGYTPEQIVSEDVYPTLTLTEVYAALHYYYEHKEEIDREIAEDIAYVKQRAQESVSPFAQKLRQLIKERREQELRATG